MNLVSNVPSFSSVQHCLYQTRNSSAIIEKTVFTNIEEVQVPEQRYQLILADYYMNGVRILHFCSPDIKEKLRDISEFFGDATFNACQRPFVELYSILGDIGSTTDTTKVVPVVFTLLCDKKQSTYEIMFDLIKCNLPQFQSKMYHCDLELAAINAATVIFQDIEIKGCYYHVFGKKR